MHCPVTCRMCSSTGGGGNFAHWALLSPTGPQPQARASHSCAWAEDRLFVYGGSKTGKLDAVFFSDLWMLTDVEVGGKWAEVTYGHEGPGPRMGHSLIYNKPQLLLIGGENWMRYSDVWALDIETVQQGNQEVSWVDSTPSRWRVHPEGVTHHCTTLVNQSLVLLVGGKLDADTPDFMDGVWSFDWNISMTTKVLDKKLKGPAVAEEEEEDLLVNATIQEPPWTVMTWLSMFASFAIFFGIYCGGLFKIYKRKMKAVKTKMEEEVAAEEEKLVEREERRGKIELARKRDEFATD